VLEFFYCTRCDNTKTSMNLFILNSKGSNTNMDRCIMVVKNKEKLVLYGGGFRGSNVSYFDFKRNAIKLHEKRKE